MTFFEKLSEQLSIAGKEFAVKTKELTDLARVNLDLLSEEEHLNEIYSLIGKKYYAERTTAPDSEMMKLILEVEDSLKQIHMYKAEINKLKKVKVCPKCHAEVSENSRFCSHCSEPLN